MVRMSDLVRGPAAAPPVPPVEEEKPRPAAVPPAPAAVAAPALTDLERLIERVVASLEDSAELFWLANTPAVPPGVDYLVVHQSRVAILAVRIGLNVGYDRARAVPLGMAGALVDAGLWQSP